MSKSFRSLHTLIEGDAVAIDHEGRKKWVVVSVSGHDWIMGLLMETGEEIFVMSSQVSQVMKESDEEFLQ